MSGPKVIPLFKVNMSPYVTDSVSVVLKSGMIGEGPKVKQFTKELAKLFDNQNIVALNSCSSALTLALRLCNIRSGDRVISTPFTMTATNCAIKALGAEIVWGRVEPETLCLSVEELPLDDTIKAVILVLVGGMVPRNFGKLVGLLKSRGIPLILDAAHALLTIYKGKHISNWADYSCFSFQSIKHLTTGDGGAITTIHSDQVDRIERLKWFGMSRKVPEGVSRLEHQMTYSIPEWGYKYHMNDISATIGLANINCATSAIDASIRNADYYQSVLDNTLVVPEGCSPSWWVYGFYPKSDPVAAVSKFQEQGIQASTMWKSNNEHACFMASGDTKTYMLKTPVFIPNGFWLSVEDRELIAEVAKTV